MNPYDLGEMGEDEAAEFLQGAGYEILERRYRRRPGEIDIVCCLRDDTEIKTIVFVEVKTRSPSRFGRPEQAVTKSKLRRIYRAAKVFMHENRYRNVLCRFDVVAVYFKSGRLEIDHFEEAFSAIELLDMD